MSVTGSRGAEPARAGVSILDMGSGMWAVIGILSALLHRQRTGEGQAVGTSLLETGVYWMNYHLVAYQANHRDPAPMGASHAAFAPYGTFPTADDDVMVGVSNDSLFRRFARGLGYEEWAEDERFRDNGARVRNRETLGRLIAARMKELPCAEWIARLDEAGVPCSRVQKVSQVMRDPQVEEMGMLPAVDHGEAGPVRMPRLPVRLSKSPPSIREAAPALGQHTAETLRRFGVEDAELEELLRLGVVEIAGQEERE